MVSVKILALVSALIVVVALTKKVSSADLTEVVMKMTEGCRKKHNLTAEDIKTIMSKQIPTTQSAKCTAACLAEQFKIIKQVGGAFQVDCNIITQMTKGQRIDEKKLAMGMEICEKCKAPRVSNKCDFAAAVATCVKKDFESRA